MQKNSTSQSGLFNSRVLVAFTLCFAGVLLAMFSFAAKPPSGVTGLRADSPRNSIFVGQHAGPLTGNATLAAAASGWSIVTSPNAILATGNNKLRGVTCVSASDCWAVGDNGFGTLIERWDGTSWAIISSPNTSVSQSNQLNGVTCASASDCWAVGKFNNGNSDQTLIERWNGTSWIIIASPNTSSTQYNLLNGVTCASASDCWAVGGNGFGTLIEHWNGTSWTIVSSPNTNSQLNGVTCASASECWAVGGNNIEQWDGSSWTIVSSPNTGGSNSLKGVTCASASECWAVGKFNNGNSDQTLIDKWDGNSWTVVSSPNTSSTESNQLNSVTCASASDCSAIGTYVSNNNEYTLIEKWDGSSWTIVTSPNSNGGGSVQDNQLNGVTCASASDCWAVGDYLSYNGANFFFQTLIEKWDGNSWTIVSSPNANLPQVNQLNGVTCASASDCWAVGYHILGSIYRTLIEHWDGTAWTVVTSPNTGSNLSNILNGVTCASASECWAVGTRFSGANVQTLIEKWDGSSWTIVSSPNTGVQQDDFLNGVTCTSASNCWAAGEYTDGTNFFTLIEKWDGSSWTIVSSPNNSAAADNLLNGVNCASASECWAVGLTGTSILQTLIEKWDGSSWTIVTSPNTSATHNVLNGVTCASASECWGVGESNNGSNDQTLTEKWDGSSWTIVTSPNTSVTLNNRLNGVTCASASECWAVGKSNNGSNDQTLIEKWDGSEWSIVSSPNTSATQNNLLQAVTCVSARDCWAAGYDFNGTVNQTLIEQFTESTCALPGLTILTDPCCDVITPTGQMTNPGWDVRSLQIAEPLAFAPAKVVFTLKMESLATVPPNTRWPVTFTSNNINYTVMMTNSPVDGATTAPIFLVGPTVGPAPRFEGPFVAADAASTFSPDGTITIVVPTSSIGSPLPGQTISGFLTRIAANPVGAFTVDSMPDSMTASGTYTLVGNASCQTPVQLVRVVSRKVHGSAGTSFDITLPLSGTRGVECRNVGALPGGATGDYQLVFSFANPLTSVDSVSASATSPSGPQPVSSSGAIGTDPHQYIVNLSMVPNAQYVTLTLANVNDAVGNFSSAVSASMGVLIGDVNATGLVDGNDVSAVQGHARQGANSTNFRLDVNATGLIDGNDVSLVQSKTRTSLPSPP